MGIFDRGGDDESAEEPPAESGQPDAEPDGSGAGAAAVAVESDAGSNQADADGDSPDAGESAAGESAPGEPDPPEPTYVAFDRQHPPEAVRSRFGDGGSVDPDTLDVLAAYATDDGRIREDVLELSLAQLEEWADVETAVGGAKHRGRELAELVDERTVDVSEELPEDEFFQTTEGFQTLTNRYDLEKAVPREKKRHFTEVNRYWVNKPYAFVVIFHSTKENETKYYLVEPHLTPI
ncbi:MAG: hypothetical protein ABEJ92_11545, partial [Halobacteriales archaeon]